MTSPRPFADAVLAYAQAGWPAILPVPPEKSPPPVGFTGADGRDTDPMQLATWAGTHAASSIALRMPDGVIGIDVDAYVKAGVTKHGAASFDTALSAWGPLPATWTSTARGAGPSRIHFYRAPAGRYATKLPGGDVEIIQRHHRYAVVWPSPHADAGDIYRWYGPDGLVSEAPPKPGELPALPTAWVEGLREGATDQGPAAADLSSGQHLIAQLLADIRPACAEITSAALTAVGELTSAEEGSRHDTATARVHQLVQLAAAGHPGLPLVLDDLAGLWEQLTAGEDRAGEWDRMLVTSARKAVTALGSLSPVGSDPCLVIGSIPLAAPAPADDRPGAEEPEPIEPARELHPLAVIGAHLFDPRGHLDQPLAQAVLERTYPVLRYAYDSRSWLLRGPETWSTRADLAEWAVALLADLMPIGNPDAEKGSDARDQAERRKRFMSSAPSSGIAKKTRALVAGGVHPCSLKITDLDREPWLLWAGGIGWDLRASKDAPTAALIDPSTPHLHSAGVAPDARPTPLWDAFTAAVWPDAELRAWALRVLSIALTGYSDKALPILIGEKDRGKTQVVVLLMSVLGSYAHAADPRLLGGVDNAHASIVYALMGRRLSFIDEGPRDGRLGQERLKQLTGGGELTGNQMHANPVTFKPAHTLVLTANDEPLLTDPAVRSRARLIPCEGDPAEVIAARAAIGHLSDRVWRAEAPGVLTAMMREAAAWLADPHTAHTAAAPEAYRYRGEQIAAEQDPIPNWLEDAVEPDEQGTRARALYETFVAWCKAGNISPGQIPTETRWGRALTRLGFPPAKRRDGDFTGWHRPLRLRTRGGWFSEPPQKPVTESKTPEPERTERGGLTPDSGGFAAGSPVNPPQDETPVITVIELPTTPLVVGVVGTHPLFAHTRTHTHAHDARMEAKPETASNPEHLPRTFSAELSARLLAAKAPYGEPQPDASPEASAAPAAKPRRTKIDPAVRAAEKAAAKQAALAQAIADAAGELVDLPAVVTRDGAVRSLALDQVPELVEAFGMLAELTVDVEHTGYPIGHADYELRTVQVGTEHAALVFDASDHAQLAKARQLVEAASMLHAHSATADLVPLDAIDAWARMFDTAIPALLADPASTGSDADGLKQLAVDVLGQAACSPAADEARGALFKAGKWLKQTAATTPVERSGWAQVDRRCTTMVRYAACDVLDTAALARVLPEVPAAVLERERTAQRMTARVAHLGVRLDGELVDAKTPEHRAALAEAGARIQAFGIDNPGSDQQVAAKLIELGAPLPRTKTGRPSVAKGGIEPFAKADGPVGDLVRARLDYQHHETVLGLFLDPYAQLVHRGDGRARPTIYTLGADTGRMSCVRPNLQQVPRQGGIRACVTADDGEAIISADFASVEVRVACALTGDTDLKAMLDAGVDLHMQTARQAYGPDATKADRYNTKRAVFGRLYGSGIPGIARTLGISESEAAAIVASLDAMTPGMTRWIEGLKHAVQGGMRTFETYSGRVVHLDPRLPHKAFNYCVQGTARELLVDTLVRWRDTRWGGARLVPVHDELLVFVPADEAEEATAALVAAMQTELYGVQIKAEASVPSFAWADAA